MHRICGGTGTFHLTQCSLGPQVSPSQAGPRSIQPSLHSNHVKPHDRQTDRGTNLRAWNLSSLNTVRPVVSIRWMTRWSSTIFFLARSTISSSTLLFVTSRYTLTFTPTQCHINLSITAVLHALSADNALYHAELASCHYRLVSLFLHLNELTNSCPATKLPGGLCSTVLCRRWCHFLADQQWLILSCASRKNMKKVLVANHITRWQRYAKMRTAVTSS